jgi:hypothetical protein
MKITRVVFRQNVFLLPENELEDFIVMAEAVYQFEVGSDGWNDSIDAVFYEFGKYVA